MSGVLVWGRPLDLSLSPGSFRLTGVSTPLLSPVRTCKCDSYLSFGEVSGIRSFLP